MSPEAPLAASTHDGDVACASWITVPSWTSAFAVSILTLSLFRRPNAAGAGSDQRRGSARVHRGDRLARPGAVELLRVLGEVVVGNPVLLPARAPLRTHLRRDALRPRHPLFVLDGCDALDGRIPPH